ncbi:XdhC family protein [Erythrobacter sp. LQ02-29]|uniref:XdhC family protein n=1 Tax=Erythrobacter sp. LQ02-29 TaxID=2920384 RepID=UPI001F4E90C6|nr:XdhC family protein [Erythrobacter sp. LQ02-29]MCP9222091.1 XdhC family protein [Erythrobacter sp. LQ02-29]
MTPIEDDHAALASACEPGVVLCTIVGIEGSFSRRIGAQLAIRPDGSVTGSLADGCLERQLASDIAAMPRPDVRRYGHGSPQIDFRLPCGGGLDILLDPAPDRDACRAALAKLEQREPANLTLPANDLLSQRAYQPALRVRGYGEDPELGALETLSAACGIGFERVETGSLSLGQTPALPPPDRWTATVLLFHDHEWEIPLLQHAVNGPGFYIGAQGGATAREARNARLKQEGVSEDAVGRIRGPVGIIPGSRTPRTLALSILGEIVGKYEALHPHG